MVQCLLGAKGNVNVKVKSSGATSILVAAQQGHLELVKCLSKSKATLGCKNKLGANAINLAVLKGHTGVVKFLVKASGARAKRRRKLTTATI